MIPSLTNFFALLGIDAVLCAMALRLLSWSNKAAAWGPWFTAVLFFALWLPVGPVQLPVLAYVRGASSDLSITLVALAGLALWQGIFKAPPVSDREKALVFFTITVGGLLLYPLALGLGNWDVYRLGWGAPGLWLVMLLIAMVARLKKFWLLPSLLALALLGWTAGVLESTNLWDYLLDPWLFLMAIVFCFRACVVRVPKWFA
jgi:hypothetical protein